jgi:hypothetical protein
MSGEKKYYLANLPANTDLRTLWNLRRQGKIDDQAWLRWEHELCRASKEGRVRAALGIDGVPISR